MAFQSHYNTKIKIINLTKSLWTNETITPTQNKTIKKGWTEVQFQLIHQRIPANVGQGVPNTTNYSQWRACCIPCLNNIPRNVYARSVYVADICASSTLLHLTCHLRLHIAEIIQLEIPQSIDKDRIVLSLPLWSKIHCSHLAQLTRTTFSSWMVMLLKGQNQMICWSIKVALHKNWPAIAINFPATEVKTSMFQWTLSPLEVDYNLMQAPHTQSFMQDLLVNQRKRLVLLTN